MTDSWLLEHQRQGGMRMGGENYKGGTGPPGDPAPPPESPYFPRSDELDPFPPEPTIDSSLLLKVWGDRFLYAAADVFYGIAFDEDVTTEARQYSAETALRFYEAILFEVREHNEDQQRVSDQRLDDVESGRVSEVNIGGGEFAHPAYRGEPGLFDMRYREIEPRVKELMAYLAQ